MTKKAEKYAEHHNVKVNSQVPITWHTSGFSHPDLPVITKDNRREIIPMEWGLIPFFMKDAKKATALSNKTLNARGETIFEKPSFRASAKNKRCAILLDGFFEHKHLPDKTKQPHFIKMKNDKSFWVGGLYGHWELDDIHKVTCSIITTLANELMAGIHNGGANAGRMPYIIPEEQLDDWLSIEADDKASKDRVLEMILPFEDGLLEAYPVGQIRGKSAVGNRQEVIKPMG